MNPPSSPSKKTFQSSFLWTLLSATCWCIAFVQPATSQAQEPVKTASPGILSSLDLQDGDCMVFLGDSITHQCLYTQYVENFFRTRYPERRIHFHNAGVSGDRAADALARFDDDVAAFEPKYVSVLLGMNDGQYEDYHPDTFGTYARGMVEILDRIRAIGAIAIVLSPTMFDEHQLELQMDNPEYRFGTRNFAHNYNALLAYYSGWLRERSNDRHLPFVDLWTPLNDLTFRERRKKTDFTLVPDAIHPGAAGQVIMAFSLLSTLPPDRRGVDNISVTLDAAGKWVANGSGTFADLKVSENNQRVSFTHTAISLPWVVPEGAFSDEANKQKWDVDPPATEGYRMTIAGHKMSNERLRVFGLPAGNYRISIDDQVVVESISHLRLGSKVELQSNTSTPQYRQALEVAHLNRERNDAAIRPLRGVWAGIKGLRRKFEAAAPDAFQAEYKKRQPQILQLLKTADEYDEKILAAAQPKARRYVIERVE